MRNKLTSLILFAFFINAALINAQGDIRAILDSQINNSVINIPKGTYILDLKDGKSAYVFSNKKNVQINGNGSTIVCNYQKQAFSFERCENVTFSNLTIEYDPPCSTQGTVVSMTADAKTLDIEIHEGYPIPSAETLQTRVHFFEKDTREMIWNLYTNEIREPIQFLEGRKIRVNLLMPKSKTYEVGDYIVLNNIPLGYLGHCLIMNYCKDMKMDRVTIYDSPAFHFAEHFCDNTHYYKCVVDRKLNDPKYPQDRLRPGIADGIHSKHSRKGPKIEECTLRYLNDDPIAINGDFYPVYKIDASRKQLYLMSRAYSHEDVMIKQGESVAIVTTKGVIRGEAQPVRVSESTPPTSAEIAKCLSYYNDIKDTRYIRSAMVRFSDEDWAKMGEVSPGDVIFSYDRIGSGFEVINNIIGHVPGRGILIKASDGKIQKNTITNTGGGPIIIAPEINWMEAGLSRNLDISENYIETCMWRQNMKRSQCAAISVVLETSDGSLAPAGGFTNIAIHRNIIKDCPMPCVFLNAIDGGYFYKNTIEPATWARDHGQNFLIPNNVEYYTKNVRNIITDKDPTSIQETQEGSQDRQINIGTDGRISVKGFENEKKEIKIFNLTGEALTEDSFLSSSNVSVNNFDKGIYIISVKCGNKNFSEKHFVF